MLRSFASSSHVPVLRFYSNLCCWCQDNLKTTLKDLKRRFGDYPAKALSCQSKDLALISISIQQLGFMVTASTSQVHPIYL